MPFGSLSVDKITTSDGFTLGGSGAAMKNRIINGAMVIDQRNAGASVTPASGTNTYTVDRWAGYASQSSKYTVQQNAGSVTPPAGFRNYLGATSSSAYSIISTDIFLIRHAIEGFNTADLNWGNANASTVTLSFWVRSSLTGTFGGSINNDSGNRFYPFSYTISAVNTWEQKSITITGDTTGTWLTTNGVGLWLNFSLGTGSSNLQTAGSWTASSAYGATGQTNLVSTNSATFYITGVQLEVGSQATSFDYRQYGTELALCQRYFQQYSSTGDNTAFMAPGYCDTSSRAFCTFQFPVYMRSAPSLTVVSATAFALYNVPADTVAASSITLTGGGSTNGIVSAATVTVNSSGVFTAGRGTVLKDASTSSAGRLQFSAEL